MFKRQAGYIVLAGFAAVLVVGLMLDDPAVQQAQLLNYEATRQVQLEFCAVSRPDTSRPGHRVRCAGCHYWYRQIGDARREWVMVRS